MFRSASSVAGRSPRACFFLLLAPIACRRAEPSREAPSPSSSSVVPAAIASTLPGAASFADAPTASPSARPQPTSDFEDQFAYGQLDAGAGDPTKLRTRPGYSPYANARFGFSVDTPRALDPMPEPTNGDGMQWRLGRLVAMTASGMNAIPEVGLSCASSPSVTAHRETKTSCWSTGTREGWVFWEREAIANDVLYSLRFQYAESLKAAMDPIVTHVNASWRF